MKKILFTLIMLCPAYLFCFAEGPVAIDQADNEVDHRWEPEGNARIVTRRAALRRDLLVQRSYTVEEGRYRVTGVCQGKGYVYITRGYDNDAVKIKARKRRPRHINLYFDNPEEAIYAFGFAGCDMEYMKLDYSLVEE